MQSTACCSVNHRMGLQWRMWDRLFPFKDISLDVYCTMYFAYNSSPFVSNWRRKGRMGKQGGSWNGRVENRSFHGDKKYAPQWCRCNRENNKLLQRGNTQGVEPAVQAAQSLQCCWPHYTDFILVSAASDSCLYKAKIVQLILLILHIW